MQTNTKTPGTNFVQLDAIEAGHNRLPDMPAPPGLARKKAVISSGDRTKKGGARKTAGQGFSTQDQLKSRAATSGAGSVLSSAQKGDIEADWNKSAADTRSELAQAAQKAKDKIDADLANTWTQQIKDLRTWQDKNLGKLGAEDIDRQYFRDSEAYMLLAQRAKIAKDAIDAQVTAFQSHLDENETAITGNGDKSKKSDLMKEREINFEGAVSDINDQSEVFSALSDNTVNKMRVGTDKSSERQYAPTGRDKQNTGDGLGTTSQADIEKNADQIQQFSEQVSQAEHAAQARGMPKIDNHREREFAYAKELGIAAKSLSGQLQNLAENKTTVKLLANKRWSIPGKAETLAGLGLVGVAESAKNFYNEISDYNEKAHKGTLTSDDRMKMATSTMNLISSVSPYIPVIGPIISPFLTVASMTLDLISENKHTPVENVFGQIKAQVNRGIGGYRAIEPPRL